MTIYWTFCSSKIEEKAPATASVLATTGLMVELAVFVVDVDRQ